jgi:hypothetical protein
MLKSTLLAAVLLASAAPGLAQTGAAPDSSPPDSSPPGSSRWAAALAAVRKACSGDIRTLCPDAEGDRSKMGQCLRQNFAKLSPDCRTQLKAMRSQRPQT